MTKQTRPRGRPRSTLAAVRARPVERSGLHEQAASRLRDMIVGGEVPAGSNLPEVEMSVALGVSRTPLREAFKLLAAEGLIELRPNRSARVPEWTRGEILELFEALAGLERFAAELAAARMTYDTLARIRGMQRDLDILYEQGRLLEYFALNQAIHRAIVDAAGNRPLADLHAQLQTRAQWARLRALSVRDRWDESAEEHRELFAALDARDATRAGETAARHVYRTGTVIAGLLDAARASSANAPRDTM